MNVTRQAWGSHKGEEIYLFKIIGEGVIVTVSNYGSILQSFIVENSKGELIDIVLGYDHLDCYLAGPYFFGANVGPIADRLANGSCILNNKRIQFSLNAGPDSMHSGSSGFHLLVWDWEIVPNGVVFRKVFDESSSGLPGDLHVSISYTLDGPGRLLIEYSASCDKETTLSITNHSYFNLDGAVNNCLEHTLEVFSDLYAETTCSADPLVTGRLIPVEGTGMDLRETTKIRDVVSLVENNEIRSAGGIDHFYATSGHGFRKHAELMSKNSGLKLSCHSSAFGVQIYTGNGLSDVHGKSGVNYNKYWGTCLEAGNMPNAVNMSGFREAVLIKPGDSYFEKTVYEVVKI